MIDAKHFFKLRHWGGNSTRTMASVYPSRNNPWLWGTDKLRSSGYPPQNASIEWLFFWKVPPLQCGKAKTHGSPWDQRPLVRWGCWKRPLSPSWSTQSLHPSCQRAHGSEKNKVGAMNKNEFLETQVAWTYDMSMGTITLACTWHIMTCIPKLLRHVLKTHGLLV